NTPRSDKRAACGRPSRYPCPTPLFQSIAKGHPDMATELKVPVLPESVSDATIADWHKKVGDAVSRDENLVDLETDKVVLEVPSPVDGVIKEIKFESGDTVESEQVLAIIEEGAAAPAPSSDAKEDDKKDDKKEAPAAGKQDKTSGEKASSDAD